MAGIVEKMNAMGSVAHLTFSGDFGGREKVAVELCRGMLKMGQPSSLFVIVEERAGSERNANLLRVLDGVAGVGSFFSTHSRFSPRLLFKLAAGLRESKVGVAHCHCYKSLQYCLLMRLFNLYKGKIVYTLHGLILSKGVRSSLIHAAQQIGLHKADGVIGCSREILKSSFPNPKGVKTTSIINAILLPEEDFSTLREGKAAARQRLAEQYSLDADRPVVVNVGRLNPQKNYPLYLDLIARMEREQTGPLPNFLIVGNGVLKDELESQAREQGIRDRVVFTGFVSDMDALYRGADVLVQTSIWEGTPMCLLEARSYGLPAVAPAVGGNVDVVNSGKDGMLYPVGNLQLLSEALEGYLADESRRNLHGEAAHAHVSEAFGVEEWIIRHLNFYLSLAGTEENND